MSKLQKNAILTGYINSYCLVCECFFNTIEESILHIQEDKHEEKLLAHNYLEKYGDNHIRKVSKGYFCEFCSLLLVTAAKVSLHILEKNHCDNKGNGLLRRSNDDVIAFEDILITENAWNTITEDTCGICNVEFEDESTHKTEPDHLLKLVQNKVEFGANNTIYRKTDDSSFQCLTCNNVFVLSQIKEHFDNPQHKDQYAKCQEAMKKHEATASQKPKPESKNKNNKNFKKADQKQNDVTASNSEDKVKQEAGSANINECKELVLKSSKTKQALDDEQTTFANVNNITYNAGNTNAYCRVCETKLPATIRCMKEHVNGKEHKSKSVKAEAPKPSKPSITKRVVKKFIEHITTVENIFHQDVVINDKYCIPSKSFMMFTNSGSRLQCHVCEAGLYEDEAMQHGDSPRHQDALMNIYVITSVDTSEFVREVRPEVYHCGYCNLVVSRWEQLTAHLQSTTHRDYKGACLWRLERHLPGLEKERRQNEMNMLQMIAMARMFRN